MPMLQFYEIAYGFLVITLEASRPNKPALSPVSPPTRSLPSLCLSTSLISISPFSLPLLPPPPLLSCSCPPRSPSLWEAYSLISKVTSARGRHFPSTNLLLILNSFFLLGLNGIPLERLLQRPFLSRREPCVSHPCPSLHLPQRWFCLSVATASARSMFKAHSLFRSRNCSDTCLSSEANTQYLVLNTRFFLSYFSYIYVREDGV